MCYKKTKEFKIVKLGVAYAKGKTLVKILHQSKPSDEDYDYLGRFIENGMIFIKRGFISNSEIAYNFKEEFNTEVKIKKCRIADNGSDFIEIVVPRKRRTKRFKQLKFTFE